MTQKTPTLVAQYSRGSGAPERVAEFRLMPDGGVSLTIINPNQSGIAEEMYEFGVEILNEARFISWKDDGPAFMRALLQPFRLTYDEYRNESEGTPGRT